MDNLAEKNIRFIKSQIQDSCEVKSKILSNEQLLKLINDISIHAVDVYKNGNKIIIAGNGGSAADAQHIAAEFVSKFYFDRPGLSAIAVTTDTSIITAIGNDYGYDNLFARQIQANGIPGDMLILISTSGTSPNIIKAIEEAKKKNIITVGLTGLKGEKMYEICDYCIKVPSIETPRIQESHIMIGHIICCIVEQEIFGQSFNILTGISKSTNVILGEKL